MAILLSLLKGCRTGTVTPFKKEGSTGDKYSLNLRKWIYLLALLFCTSCNNFTSSSTDTLAGAEIPEDLLIRFERTGCYAAANACPTYILTVNADGTVIFEGKEVTELIGKAKDSIGQDKLRQLIEEFQKANYFELENSYDQETCPATATDSPSANISIQMNGKKKSVSHYLGCYSKYPEIFPPELFELERKIDEIVGTKRWTGEQK